MEEEKKVQTIEEDLEELERIVEQMEQPGSSLEDAFAFYESGMKLVKECSGKLDLVEKKILVLSEDGHEEF